MRKTSVVFLAISLLCVIVNSIYGLYSHGVPSDYLTFMFACPLLGGTVVYLLLWALPKARMPGRFSINLYNSGIAALTVGSALRGVFDIAGTSSPYQPVFMIAGITMVSLGAFCYFVSGPTKTSLTGNE
jgi:hypothetical protein